MVTSNSGGVFEIAFADGKRVRFHSGSAGEFFLNAVFMKFFFLALGINALLQFRFDVGGSLTWVTFTIWITIGFVLLIWFVIAGTFVRFLQKGGHIRLIYTPFLTIPGVVLTELSAQLIAHLLLGTNFRNVENFLPPLARDFVVLILFDILFGTYVAPLHPMRVKATSSAPERAAERASVVSQPAAQLRPEDDRTSPHAGRVAPEPKTQPGGSAETEQPEPQNAQTIQIGGERVILDSLLRVQVEDHYLQIELPNRKLMVRGRFNDLVQMLDATLGIQINRSTWLARKTISHAQKRADYKVLIVLKDGTTHAVARSRWAGTIEKLQGWNIQVRQSD